MTISDAPQPNSQEERPIIEDLPVSLLDQPLEYISADHSRQRLVCDALVRFADAGRVDCNAADTVSTFLSRELLLHHRDEDEHLFPSLRKRAHAQDKLDELLSGLSQDHSQSMAAVGSIKRILSQRPTAGQIKISGADRDEVVDYAKRERRHLAIENGIVMVIARKRLKDADREAMSRAMKRRRGLTD